MTAKRSAVLALVTAAAAVTGVPLASADNGETGRTLGPPFAAKNEAAARALEQERAAYDLLNRATRRVAARRPSCRPSAPPRTSAVTLDVPGRAVLDQIAALRRPATEADAVPADQASFGLGETYVDYVRSATAANGQKFSIVIARWVWPTFRVSGSCLDAQHAELLSLLDGKPRRVRSIALRALADTRRRQERDSVQPPAPQDGIFLFTRIADGRSGGGGGGGDAAQFARTGTFNSHGGSRTSRLNGLVPDGVATVTLHYPKTVSRGRYYKPTVFPSSYTRTVRVQENVLSLRVPRGAIDAFPARMVWRAADGSVLRVIKRP